MIGRVLDSMRAVCPALARGTGGWALERDDLVATVVPAIPERSVFNSVIYEDPATLARCHEELAAAYDAVGVRAWTVWVPPGHPTSLLAERGHVLDAEPAAMVLEDLAMLGPAPGPPPGVTVEHPGDPAELGRLNDAAYGLSGGEFERAIAATEGLDVHLAYADGRPAAGTAVFAHGDVAELSFVATAPWAQRRGLASLVVHRALAHARERGLRLSTLEATRAGEPVYARLGYRPVGRLQMWERRRA